MGQNMQSALMGQGFDLMIFGMGTVFVFLTLLVFCTLLMSSVISRFLPDAEIEPPANDQAIDTAQPIDSKTLSIIQAAIYAHKQK